MTNPGVDKFGDKRWYNKLNQLHREDGPAVEWTDGTREWWVDGKLHRADGPAVEWTDGGRDWYVNGKRHRLDGPAIEGPNGHKEWYFNGKLHREDGPAVEYVNGNKSWWVNGSEVDEKDHPFVKILHQYSLYSKWKNNELTTDDWVLIRMSLPNV